VAIPKLPGSHFRKALFFIGVFLLNPIAWICIAIDLIIFFAGFGFIWQITTKKLMLKPFIFLRNWVLFSYSRYVIVAGEGVKEIFQTTASKKSK